MYVCMDGCIVNAYNAYYVSTYTCMYIIHTYLYDVCSFAEKLYVGMYICICTVNRKVI